MDIRHLQALRAVVDVGSFTGAAECLFLTQSAVSVQIRQLEEAVGTTLFTRLPSGVRATHAGEVLYRYAGTILAVAEEARRELAAIEDGRDSVVRIATTDVCAFLVSQPMASYAALYPHTDVAVFEGSADAARRRVASGDADLAVVPVVTADADAAGGGDALLELDLVVIGPARHPLTGCDELTLDELSAYPLALNERGHVVRDLVDAAARPPGTELRILFESNWASSLLRAVESGAALSIVPAAAMAHYDDEHFFVARIPELDGRIVVQLVAVDGSRRPSVRALADEIVAHAAAVRSVSRAHGSGPTPRTTT